MMSEGDTQQGDPEVGTCHICAQTFTTQEDLSKHLMEAHGGKEPATGSG
jgi:hypothetical protein